MNETKTLTTKEIRDWMDRQVNAYHIALERIGYTDADGWDNDLHNIGVQDRGIHLASDTLRYIAQRLDLDIYLKSRKEIDEEYPYQLNIFYKDTIFFALESEEEYNKHEPLV